MPAAKPVALRRCRAFARALAAMVAEQAGPRPDRFCEIRSRTVHSARSTRARRSTTARSSTLDDLVRRLEPASSDLELLLVFVFVKDAARRAGASTCSPCGWRTSRRKTFSISISRPEWPTPCGSRRRSPKAVASCGPAQRSTRPSRTWTATVLRRLGRGSRRCWPSSGPATLPWCCGPPMSRRVRARSACDGGRPRGGRAAVRRGRHDHPPRRCAEHRRSRFLA